MNDRFRAAVDRTLPGGARIPLERILNGSGSFHHPLPRRLGTLLLAALLLCLAAGAAALGLTVLDVRRKWENEKGPMISWSLEDKAAFADEAQQAEAIWQAPPYRTAGEGEIGKEEARRAALAALEEKYGLTAETLSAWRYQEELTYLDADFPEEGCFYAFTWINDTPSAAHPGGDVYVVHVDPATGEVMTVEGMEELAG